MDTLRFGGSLWCNVDITLRNLDQVYGRGIGDLDVSVTEWYILRALYQRDGQHATELARAVGRAATSFTPLLDGLEAKGLVTRRPETHDRRAIRIHLTDKGKGLRRRVEASAEAIEQSVRRVATEKEWASFERVLAQLNEAPVRGGH